MSLALGSTEGSLDLALKHVAVEDAPKALDVVLRELALLSVAQQLREASPSRDGDAASQVDDAEGEFAASDDDLPPDPWKSSGDGDRTLWSMRARSSRPSPSTAPSPSYSGRSGRWDEQEFIAIVLERSLAAMAQRQRPSPN